MKLEVLRCRPPGAAGEHPPVLFVHGSYCGAWIWAERFMPYFARHGYPCHAVSLRGHGGSEGDLSEAGLQDYVADVAAAAGRLAAPPILIGHSMGGQVVQRYLARHRAEAAVLLSSVPPSGLASSTMHMTMFAPDILWQLGLLQTLGPRAVSPEAARRGFLSDRTPAAAARHLMHRMQKESPRVGAELMMPWQPGPPPRGRLAAGPGDGRRRRCVPARPRLPRDRRVVRRRSRHPGGRPARSDDRHRLVAGHRRPHHRLA